MKVLFCSSEVFPFAKTGGLADVSSALPCALEKLGCKIKVALPKYRCVKRQGRVAKLGKTIEVYLVENDKHFDHEGLYGTDKGDYSDNLERFAFFCKQILRLLKKTGFQPDIIHCNDWQTALVPVYLKTLFRDDAFFKKTKTIFTIHNLAYQGLFPKEDFKKMGLSDQLFNIRTFEFFGKVNLLKAGLVFADFITTVSPTYAKEVQKLKYGCGLDDVLKERRKDLLGIINGLDYSVWDPSRDDKIFRKYERKGFANKYINKVKLQQELKLACNKDIPLLGVVGRLAEQKGIELILSNLDKMAKLNLQFILLGTGDQKYHLLFDKVKQKKHKGISINLRFDEILAHKIYAGCDMFLMPSYYEPCGLGQLISLKYGTIPIVRKTGGLADTIINCNSGSNSGNGFVFEKATSGEMLKAIKRATFFFNTNKARWQKLALRAMEYDFSWERSAQKYIKLYTRVLNEG